VIFFLNMRCSLIYHSANSAMVLSLLVCGLVFLGLNFIWYSETFRIRKNSAAELHRERSWLRNFAKFGCFLNDADKFKWHSVGIHWDSGVLLRRKERFMGEPRPSVCPFVGNLIISYWTVQFSWSSVCVLF